MANPTDTINNTTNFVRIKGKTEVKQVLFAASIAAEEGAIVYPDPGNAGQFTIADSTAWNNFGVIKQTIATTDSDYASTKLVSVEFPKENGVVWKGTATALAQTDEWTYVDLTSSLVVNDGASSKKVIYVEKFISLTEGHFIFAGNLGAGIAMAATS